MITTLIGSIFDTEPKDSIIIHQANCFNTLGDGTCSGVARLIGQKYPEAAEADGKTVKGDKGKMGAYSSARCADGRHVINLYSQYNYGGPTRNTRYDSLTDGLIEVEKILSSFQQQSKKKFIVHIPYGLGSALGGGSWHIVNAIIESVFSKSDVDVVICKLEDQKELF